jgi:hypothetical protein
MIQDKLNFQSKQQDLKKAIDEQLSRLRSLTDAKKIRSSIKQKGGDQNRKIKTENHSSITELLPLTNTIYNNRKIGYQKNRMSTHKQITRFKQGHNF